MMSSTILKAKSELPTGSSSADILNKLMAEVTQGGAKMQGLFQQQADGNASVLLLSQQCLRDMQRVAKCQTFLLANNDRKPAMQPAFQSMLKKVRQSFCQCGTADEYDPGLTCEFHDTNHNVSDMVFGVSTLMEMEDIVPNDLTTVGAAALLVAAHVAEQPQPVSTSPDAKTTTSHKGKAWMGCAFKCLLLFETIYIYIQRLVYDA